MVIGQVAIAAGAKKAIEKVLNDIYELSKNELRKRVNHWKTKGKIDTLYTKMKNVRKVKTIWQVEKEVDLIKFYHPSKAKIGDKPKPINDLSDFEYEGNIIIQGTIGQGKSIFFRYLTLQEMLKGKAIPLFVELRRVREGQTLTEHLLEEIKSLGLDVDQETLRFLAENGKIILFLDAFDEVRESQRTATVIEIESLAKQYDKLRILISSRPNSGIEVSPFFRVLELAPLVGDEYKEVITKMAQDEKVSADIIKGVEDSKGKIGRLLTTPLMVALLMVRYRIGQTIPENEISFYEGLFNILLTRHDKTKAGYIRERKSGLGDTALLQIFNGICFLTRKKDQGTLAFNELCNRAKETIEINSQKCSPEQVLADIIDITCLILEEGGECRFIHKSIQQYHAASFIKEQPDEAAAKFYEAMFERGGFWEQELEFLSTIDKYRFSKDFLIPDARCLLGLETNVSYEKWQPSDETVRKVARYLNVAVTSATPNLKRISWQVTGVSWSLSRTALSATARKLIKLDWSPVANAIKEDRITAMKVKTGAWGREAKLLDVLDRDIMRKEVQKAIEMGLQEVWKGLAEATKYVEHVEQSKKMFEF